MVRTFTGLFGLGPLARDGQAPGYFADLQLDRLVGAVTAGPGGADLEAAFRIRLDDPAAIEQRQSVLADLADDRLREALRAFCDGLARCDQQLAEAARCRHRAQAQRWRLDAVASYADVVDEVTAALAGAEPSSPALRQWRDWLQRYRADPAFVAPATGARALLAELEGLRYTLTIAGDEIVAAPFDGQDDLAEATTAMFERFRAGDAAPHEFDLRAGAEMDRLHEAVLDLVVRLFPEVFDRVGRFVAEHATIRHPVIDEVERELRFALAWLGFIAPLRDAGLPFCLPGVRAEGRLQAAGTFDVLLAHKLAGTGELPVTNDATLDGGEQLLVVTGPNQGGKTTFARTIGQLHHLAALGLPVPGRAVALRPPAAILTHFERGDRTGDLRGRLEDEVTRMARLLGAVTAGSLVILNEMFSSTGRLDARAMSTDVLRAVLDAGATGVCVTFIDELSRLDPRIVSLVTGIDAESAGRTFRIARGRADGEAYALALAARYGLTRDQLRARIEAHA